MEAIISLHNRYSDRVKRAKSRIKFLVDKFGPEGFVEKYREELARTKEALAAQDYPKGEWEPGWTAKCPAWERHGMSSRRSSPVITFFPSACRWEI